MNDLTLAPEFSGEEEAAGEIPDPRQPGRVLRVRTRYLRGVDAAVHRIAIDGGCLKKTLTADPFVTRGMKGGRALYVLDEAGQLLAADASIHSLGAAEHAVGAEHVPDVLELLQHSSLVAGGPVRCAGELATDGRGRLRLVSNRSARYRPGAAHLVDLLAHLARAGVPLAGVTVELGSRQHDAAAFLAAGGAPVTFRGVY